MNVSSEMRTLCDNIISTSASRTERLNSLRDETRALRRRTRRMVKDFHDSFETKARDLHAALRDESDARMRTVAGLRSEFRKDARAVKADLAAARRAWAEIAKR